MTSQEIYDRYFIDEEYSLYDAPMDVYSYRSGWNEALKRAAIVIKSEIRPKGEWLHKEFDTSLREYGQCSNCLQRERVGNFCRNCGADMRGDKE